MKTRLVAGEEITPEKGLRAEAYVAGKVSQGYFEKMEAPEEDDPAFRLINRVIARCYQTAKKSGWWEKYDDLKAEHPELFTKFFPEIVSSKLALMHSEQSEALEELREKRLDLYYSVPGVDGGRLSFDTVNEARAYLDANGPGGQRPKPEGFGVELADAVIRIFDLAAWLDIDLGQLIRMKMAYNEKRPYRHGNKML